MNKMTYFLCNKKPIAYSKGIYEEQTADQTDENGMSISRQCENGRQASECAASWTVSSNDAPSSRCMELPCSEFSNTMKLLCSSLRYICLGMRQTVRCMKWQRMQLGGYDTCLETYWYNNFMLSWLWSIFHSEVLNVPTCSMFPGF